VIEITEGFVLSSIDESMQLLDALRARGTRIALDDFGTGYSSLSYARQLPIDLVKIDKSFTDDLDATNAGLVPTIMHLANTLGAAVVVEGVETQEQLTELTRLDCQLAQGYLFSPPVPAGSFTEIARQGRLSCGGPHAAPVRSAPNEAAAIRP
jgi:EAL domain-containing protein (putative c-di-GMP-specific phosphodiesterase class I)